MFSNNLAGFKSKNSYSCFLGYHGGALGVTNLSNPCLSKFVQSKWRNPYIEFNTHKKEKKAEKNDDNDGMLYMVQH